MRDEKLLDTFGKHIVHLVRDEVIQATDQALLGQRRDIYSRHLYSLAERLSEEGKQFAHILIPFVVDSTIEVFLQQFDLNVDTLQIHVQQDDGTITNLLEWTDGLEGEYGARENGWAQAFSQQRPDVISRDAERLSEQRRNAADES